MIRPTALGWKSLAFFAALVGAFFAAPYQNLFFLLLVFLSTLAVLGAWWTVRNAAGVAAEVAPIAAFPAGAGSHFTARISAPRPDRFQLRVVLDLGAAGRATAQVATLATTEEGLATATVTGPLPALPRGVHVVRGAWLETVYPFGIVRVRRAVDAVREVVVHPAPAALRNAPGGGLAGLASALGGAGSDQPSGLRDWRDGDEVRAIHWRATARRGRPVVTERDAMAGDGLEVVIDRRCAAEDLEEALSVAAALVLAARDTKERLTIHTQGTSRTFGPGHATWDECLRLLAAADALPSHAPPPPPAATGVLRLPSRRQAVAV